MYWILLLLILICNILLSVAYKDFRCYWLFVSTHCVCSYVRLPPTCLISTYSSASVNEEKIYIYQTSSNRNINLALHFHNWISYNFVTFWWPLFLVFLHTLSLSLSLTLSLPPFTFTLTSSPPICQYCHYTIVTCLWVTWARWSLMTLWVDLLPVNVCKQVMFLLDWVSQARCLSLLLIWEELWGTSQCRCVWPNTLLTQHPSNIIWFDFCRCIGFLSSHNCSASYQCTYNFISYTDDKAIISDNWMYFFFKGML